MEQQPPNDPAAAGELQFDRADFGEAAPAGPLQCKVCNQPIAGAYYEINGEVVCAACQAKAVALRTGGSAVGRVLRATAFGVLAGAVGAGIYYAILALTGYQIGLISILVGFMVGFAVSFGSHQRGGWFYQLLAVGLTYASIVSTYVPMIVGELRQMPMDEELAAVSEPAQLEGEQAEPIGEPLFAEEPDPQQPAEAVPAGAQPEPAPEGEAEVAEVPDVVLWIIAVPLAFAAPFLAGFENILGILIIGFGLWQAWQLNRKRPFEVSGPFQVAGARVAP
jgi:hypothetical protein